jgi:hypothetical protein
MTDVSDAQLRQFVSDGLSQREISKRTGIPRSTLYRRFQRLGLAVAPAPPAPPVPAPPAAPAMTFVAVPEIQEILSLVKDLQARVGTLEQTRAPPALPVPPAPPAGPAPPAPERTEIQQWTIRISKAWIDYVKQVAYERRLNPSEVVEACLWQALGAQQPPTS